MWFLSPQEHYKQYGYSLQQTDIRYFVAHVVLETVVTLVRGEHMLQVVWKAVELAWRVCGIHCQGESIGAKVKTDWAIQLSSSAQHIRARGV